MIKREIRYTDDGEEVWNSVTEYKGRFHEEGYSLYAHGNTISSRKSASFPLDVSKLDLANMTILSRHLLLNSNVLGYRTKKGYEPMDLKRIGDVIGVKERQAYRFYRRMAAARMMVKVKGPTRYIINPVYFFNGKTINDELYWRFNDQLDEHFSKWIRETFIKRREEGQGTS